MNIIDYLIIAAVLVLISLIVVKINKKDFAIKINKLLEYLGGKENIINIEQNMSRINIKVKDPSIVNKDGIQKLGAKGIVEIEDEFKIILGANSKKIIKYLNDIK